MVRKILLFLTCLSISSLAMAQSSTVLRGVVTDSTTGETVIGASVAIYKGTTLKTGEQTDIDGNFSINVDPGKYDVKVTYVGYSPAQVTGVDILAGKINNLDFKLATGEVLGEVVIKEYKKALIQQDNTTSGMTLTSSEIAKMPVRDVSAMAGLTVGVGSTDGGGDLKIKGSRSDGTDYYVDGVRVNKDNLPPAQEIEQLDVKTGGIEAQYGDVTGGVISITTKGPSDKFTGGLDLESSKYLDPYNNNLASFNIAGPLLRKTIDDKKVSVLGFRLSGQYVYKQDDSPSGADVITLSDAAQKMVEANPVSKRGNTVFPTGELLTEKDVVRSKAKPDEGSHRYDVTGKIDARLSKAIDITLTGGLNKSSDQFTPGDGRSETDWRLMNSARNPFKDATRYRGSFRFRHRLGGNPLATDVKKQGIIRNASYTIQLGYEDNQSIEQDPIHKGNLFNYGYIGEFRDTVTPTIEFTGQDALGNPIGGHVGYLYSFTKYKAGTVNPILAAYNGLSTDIKSKNDLPAQNGRVNSTFDRSWELFRNPGKVYNRYEKLEDEIITLNATSGFNIVPSTTGKGSHSISFGILYEQRAKRKYTILPFELWEQARLLANSHFNGLDTNKIVGTQTVDVPQLGPTTVNLYANKSVLNSDAKFPLDVRAGSNTLITDYINTDILRPDQLSLSQFSAPELTNRKDLISYYGYDYLGNKLAKSITFDDFFTMKKDGRRYFPVAPVQPIYQAAYIQDKFAYKDIIFRVGLRVDRYDANTKVLKDPYSMYEITGAKDFYSQVGGTKPGEIGDDFKVYVDGSESKTVKAFRSGDQWFYPNGTAANDGNVIFGGGSIYPRFTDPKANIQSEGFQTNTAFEDYKPQVNIMPRLAFSFPISEQANFFANYDVLASRPSSENIATALDYYYFFDADRTPTANPNLKSQRTIYYEVGFQQALSSNSALKLSAYYKELRDLIQRRTYLYVPVVSNYDSYGNLDFGTIKGFTAAYDLRRTNNVQLQLGYTLQFADGTGSDANSQRGLTSRGNLRNLFPLSYDERHNLQGSIDYRFDSGKKYTGPRVMGVNILEEFGVNLLVAATSGEPYTIKQTPQRYDKDTPNTSGGTTVGGVNGARLPWKYRLDLRVDKNFSLSKSEKHPLNMNLYVRAQNILDTRNIVGTYSASGSATDDGYIRSTFGQQEVASVIAQGRNISSFQDYYNWIMVKGGNFSLPRRIFAGAVFSF